ncbi:MAG: AbrB/MazE/SpoVT family DNA-binding domain-containing protein [Bdellovibrionales bacterium]|nr:AbrB/MazE/SpoVT family DNA-binding domain-containing protein [Bdellovibrionales bacterium]
MSAFATTKLSSKGQVVIPEDIRSELNLHPGAQFAIIGQGNTVILKLITPPTLDDIQAMLDTAKHEAQKAGLKQGDVKKAIRRARRSKK